MRAEPGEIQLLGSASDEGSMHSAGDGSPTCSGGAMAGEVLQGAVACVQRAGREAASAAWPRARAGAEGCDDAFVTCCSADLQAEGCAECAAPVSGHSGAPADVVVAMASLSTLSCALTELQSLLPGAQRAAVAPKDASGALQLGRAAAEPPGPRVGCANTASSPACPEWLPWVPIAEAEVHTPRALLAPVVPPPAGDSSTSPRMAARRLRLRSLHTACTPPPPSHLPSCSHVFPLCFSPLCRVGRLWHAGFRPCASTACIWCAHHVPRGSCRQRGRHLRGAGPPAGAVQ
jgi:hypothetical protein